VLPGMNAVATLAQATTNTADRWLVPTNALATTDNATTVTLVRNGANTTLAVTPSTVQGEWTVVQSAELQAGDQVVGSVTSNLDSNSGFPGGGMAGGVMSAGGPPQ